VRAFADVIAGMDPLGHTEIWQKVFSLTSPRPGGIGVSDRMPAPLPRNERPQIMAAIGTSTLRYGTSRTRRPACRCSACSAARASLCRLRHRRLHCGDGRRVET
jgi:hypothetical protein